MKRVMRCHDFRSDQGVRRRPYREYGLGARRGDGRKVVPARRVAAELAKYAAAHFVARLADIRDISCAPLSRYRLVLAATHTCFIMLGTLSKSHTCRRTLS